MSKEVFIVIYLVLLIYFQETITSCSHIIDTDTHAHTHTHTQAHTHKQVRIKIQIIILIGNNHLCVRTCDCSFTHVTDSQYSALHR